jgi:hypothetical protein
MRTSYRALFACACACGLALTGCLAETAPAPTPDDESVDRPIPKGPAVERPEPSQVASQVTRSVRLAPEAVSPGTHNASPLGLASPTTPR